MEKQLWRKLLTVDTQKHTDDQTCKSSVGEEVENTLCGGRAVFSNQEKEMLDAQLRAKTSRCAPTHQKE